MVGTTEFATDRTVARAVAETVHFPWKCHEPWYLPWKPASFPGSPLSHLRQKSNHVHPCQNRVLCSAQPVSRLLYYLLLLREKENMLTQMLRLTRVT